MRGSTSYTSGGTLPSESAAQPLQSIPILGGLSRWTFWITRGALAILDQALVAASNFLMGILLARWLLPEQYGSYALAFAIFLLLSAFHQALLIEPQRIFGPSDYPDCLSKYLGVLLWMHAGLSVVLILALGSSAWLMHVLGRQDSLPGTLAGVAVAAPCVLLMWLARGAFYVRLSPQYSVAGSAIYCAAVFGSLFLVQRLGIVSSFSAFLVMGLGALLSSAVLLARLKPVLKLSVVRPSWKTVGHQNWKYGRWVLASLILNSVAGDIYYPLVSSFSGIAAAGELKALLNFSLPAAQTLAALSVFFLPYASRVHQGDGVTGLKALIWKMAWLFAALAIVYWVALILLSSRVLHLFYGSRYTQLGSLIPWVAAGSLPWNLAVVPTVALRAVRSSASIFVIYCASCAVAVLVGIPTTWAFGLPGALWAMVLSNMAALIVAIILVSRKLRTSSSS